MSKRPTFIPYRNSLTVLARKLRANMTEPERRLWFGFLRGVPHPVSRQKPLGDYIVDFYCARCRMAIELDGDSHYQPGADAQDADRDRQLGRLGIRVLRFTNEQVMREFEWVCERIWAEMQSPLPPFIKGGTQPPP